MFKAIVYSSNTGHTERYARMIGEKIGLPVLSLEEAKQKLEKGSKVIYMGWLMASSIVGYGAAKRKFDVRAVCGIGLCTTGALLNEVRKTARVPADIPLFTLQGGMDHEALKGIYKNMIDVLIKVMTKKKSKSEDEQEMLSLIIRGGDYVREENCTAFLEWYTSETR